MCRYGSDSGRSFTPMLPEIGTCRVGSLREDGMHFQRARGPSRAARLRNGSAGSGPGRYDSRLQDRSAKTRPRKRVSFLRLGSVR